MYQSGNHVKNSKGKDGGVGVKYFGCDGAGEVST